VPPYVEPTDVAMSQLELPERNAAADTGESSSAYVPTLQRTEGSRPIAATAACPTCRSTVDGDAERRGARGRARQIAEGRPARFRHDRQAPPGRSRPMGLGFRD